MLNQTAIYAMRAMATLSSLSPGETIRAPELSGRTAIPTHYVSKVMRRLVLAKLVRGQRGHGGGFQLARAPATIRLAEILAAVGAMPEPNRCVFGWGACNAKAPCPLHPIWSRLGDTFESWAEGTTLADAR